MSVFWEHILPGSFFMVFGVWLIVQTWRHYFVSLTKRGQPYMSQVSYSTQCRRYSVDLMALLLCICGFLGSVTQLTHLHYNPSYQEINNNSNNGFVGRSLDVTTAHHVTMYCFFGLAGAFKLLHPVLKGLVPWIEEVEYLVLIMAFAVQALLFKFHLIGRDILDTMLHTYSLYCVYACIIMTFAELIFRNQVLLSLGRSYFIILSGTWLWQLAFILDSPFPGHVKWDPDNHDDIMLTTLMFSWHIGCVFLFSVSCGVGWVCVCRKKGKLEDAELVILEPVVNGYTHLTNQNEDVETTVENLEM